MICSRSAGEDHADLLSYIIRESFREQAVILKMNPACYPNYSAFETGEKVRARLSSGDHALLFYVNDEAVGTISYQIAPADSKVGYIKRFAILPAYRKRGYSELLMNLLLFPPGCRSKPFTVSAIQMEAKHSIIKVFYSPWLLWSKPERVSAKPGGKTY